MSGVINLRHDLPNQRGTKINLQANMMENE